MLMRFVLLLCVMSSFGLVGCDGCEPPPPEADCDCADEATGDPCGPGELGLCRSGVCYVWTPNDSGDCRALGLSASCLDAPLYYCAPTQTQL